MISVVGSGNLTLTNVPARYILDSPAELDGAHLTSSRICELQFANDQRYCLLDQTATVEMSPQDGDLFDAVVCGGILGHDEFDGPMM